MKLHSLACAVGLLAASSGATTTEEIGTIRQVYDGTLTTDLQVNTFRHIERLFPIRIVPHGANALPLLRAPKPLAALRFTSAAKSYDLVDYLALNRVTAILVLKAGKIAYEDYEMGNDEHTRWMSMSMAKTITSTLIGAAIRDGYIKSIDDAVTNYVPALKGSAYDGVSIRYLLEMASGVRWDETYTDPKSDRRLMLEAQIAQHPGEILRVMAGLPRAATPGSVWNYSTGETYVAGAVLRAAVGRSLSQYLSEKIWTPMGMESDATWWLDSPNGAEIGGSGISATLRDYGRVGLFLMNDGFIDGKPTLPDGWMTAAGSEKIIGGKPVSYGYMIWPCDGQRAPVNAGAYQAIGIYGQYIYVNAREHVVIVVWSAQSKPTDRQVVDDEDFFAAATLAVR